MKPITVSKAVAYLRAYQQWRRGESGAPQPSPSMVGACLDLVLDAVENRAAPSQLGAPHQDGNTRSTP